MFIRRIWIFLSLLVLGCSSAYSPRPKLDPVDCFVRSDCTVVRIINSTKYDTELRINGIKAGNFDAYDMGLVSVFREQMKHGNCIVAFVKFPTLANRPVIISSEICPKRNQWVKIEITDTPLFVWVMLIN